MLKATRLRSFLTRHVPGLAANPDRLQLFVDQGGIICRATQTLSYEHRYSLEVVLTPFVGDIDTLFVPLLAWIATNEPLLLERYDRDGQQPFSYKAEILDDDQVDLSLTIALTERVIVTPRDAGGYVAQPLDEPSFPDQLGGDVPALVSLRRIFADNDVVAETHDPVWLAEHPRP